MMCNWDSSINADELTFVRLAKVADSMEDLKILPVSFTIEYSHRTPRPMYSTLLQAMNAELVVVQMIVTLSPAITVAFCWLLILTLIRSPSASCANPAASKDNKMALVNPPIPKQDDPSPSVD